MARLSPFVRALQARPESFGRVVFLLEALEEKLLSSTIHIVGRIDFQVVVGLRFLFLAEERWGR